MTLILIVVTLEDLFQTQPLCMWLAGKALIEAQEYSDALRILFTEEEQMILEKNDAPPNNLHLYTPFISDKCILEGFTRKGVSNPNK